MKKKNEKKIRHKVRTAFLESFDKDLIVWDILQGILDDQLIEAIEYAINKNEDKNEKNTISNPQIFD